MKYMGSKNRIAKYILPIMLKERKQNQYWVEPFVGGANIIDKVTGLRIGFDLNRHVVSALISIRDCVHRLPKNNTEFTEEDYKKLRLNDDYEFKSYAGFSFSYGGKWLGGWCRDTKGFRDYVNEAYRNAIKQSSKLNGVCFYCSDYIDIEIPKRSLVYCDPPYCGTTKYSTVNFDHDTFWNWCRTKAREGHTVFVSEYEAPKDFVCVWEKELASSLTKDTGAKKSVERLFKVVIRKRKRNKKKDKKLKRRSSFIEDFDRYPLEEFSFSSESLDFLSDEELEDSLVISQEMFENDLSKIHGQVSRANKIVAVFKGKQLVAKAAKEAALNQAKMEVRELIKERGDKPTDKLVEIEAELNSTYVQMNKFFIEADIEYRKAKGVVAAISAKRDALLAMVRLYIQEKRSASGHIEVKEY